MKKVYENVPRAAAGEEDTEDGDDDDNDAT